MKDIPKGWQARASIIPAPPPAVNTSQHALAKQHRIPKLTVPMRLVAAEAGFLPPGPLTFFADMATVNATAEKGDCYFRCTEGKGRGKQLVNSIQDSSEQS